MNFLCNKIGFPKEATEYIHQVYNGIKKNNKIYSSLIAAKDSFLGSTLREYAKIIDIVHEETGISIYTLNLIMILSCAKKCKSPLRRTWVFRRSFLWFDEWYNM